jgi:hypothetical protein
MSKAGTARRVCESCRETSLPGYNPATFRPPRRRALFERQHPADPGAGDDPAAWVRDTGPVREALARLDFQAVLVIYRAGAGVTRREPGDRAGLPESVIWYREAGRRQGIYDIRQLLQLADSLKAPRLALSPARLGQPDALSDLLPGPAAATAARALAARLAQHGCQVSFRTGRDPAVFKVTGLPGRPDVEVSAGNDGSASCHYTGCTPGQASKSSPVCRPSARAARRPSSDGRCPARPPGHPRRQSQPEGRPDVSTTCLAGRTAPGELLRLVADGLAGAGLDVRPPADTDGCRLDIAWPGARCTLAVGDGGSAEWEYWPWSADEADPGLTADLATVLLTGRSGPQPRLGPGYQRDNVTFKGVVGLELKARGLDVELAVYCDETVFDTFAEIIATVPGPGDSGGQVCVTDDGCLTWTRDYPAGAADPASIAASVVEAVTRAMALLRPAGAGRARHG